MEHTIEQVKFYTVDEFFAFITQPEHISRDYELIGGRIIEVVSNPTASQVGAKFARYIGALVDDNQLGRVTGADGGYMVSGEPYIPDVGYISYERQPKLEQLHGYNVLSPDLAVEVLSPSNTAQEMSTKVSNYLAAGTVVWIADPDTQMIYVHVAGQPVKKYTADDTLDGGTVLPDFSVSVKKLFPDRE